MKRFVLIFLFLATMCLSSYSQALQFSDLKFGKSQFSDAQWDVGACMYSNTCNIYGLSGIGTTWNTGSPVPITTSQYISFTATGNATNPWHMYLYNSNGSVARDLGVGKLAIQGVDNQGHYFFFFTNANWNGTVFSLNYGFANSNGFSFTGTGSPTVPQTNTMAAGGSSTPLSAGQTGGSGASTPPPPPPPTVVSTVSTTSTTTSTSGTITYTYNQPVIITTWSDGTTTTANNGNAVLIRTVNTGQFSATTSYVNKVTTFATRPTNDSKVYINQIGDYNTITIDQTGTKNNFVNYVGNGNNNNISTTQSSTSSTATNYVDIKVGSAQSSSSNNINVQQSSTGGAKGAFINVQDNNNAVTLKQQDSGNHWAEISVSGGNKSIDVTQQGSAGHMASVQLTGPQPASLTLQQSGSTQQFYSIQSNCTTPGGCAPITVQQGR